VWCQEQQQQQRGQLLMHWHMESVSRVCDAAATVHCSGSKVSVLSAAAVASAAWHYDIEHQQDIKIQGIKIPYVTVNVTFIHNQLQRILQGVCLATTHWIVAASCSTTTITTPPPPPPPAAAAAAAKALTHVCAAVPQCIHVGHRPQLSCRPAGAAECWLCLCCGALSCLGGTEQVCHLFGVLLGQGGHLQQQQQQWRRQQQQQWRRQQQQQAFVVQGLPYTLHYRLSTLACLSLAHPSPSSPPLNPFIHPVAPTCCVSPTASPSALTL
jgi:hypothetical protein